MRFFTYETQLPDDVGFSLFGSVHLAWLAGILAFTTLAALWFSQRPAYRQRRISWAVAWLLCAMIVVEKVVLALTGHLNVYSLPFHLCELAPLLYLLFAWRHWDWLGQVLYTLCLPGAAAALLFPDWSAYPQWNFMNLNSFLVHGLLILFPILQLVEHTIRPRLGRCGRSGFFWPSWCRLCGSLITPLAPTISFSTPPPPIHLWPGF